jgi:hypothetical protein
LPFSDLAFLFQPFLDTLEKDGALQLTCHLFLVDGRSVRLSCTCTAPASSASRSGSTQPWARLDGVSVSGQPTDLVSPIRIQPMMSHLLPDETADSLIDSTILSLVRSSRRMASDRHGYSSVLPRLDGALRYSRSRLCQIRLQSLSARCHLLLYRPSSRHARPSSRLQQRQGGRLYGCACRG